MSIKLNRATQKVSDVRVELAKVDLQVECLQETIKEKKEEAIAIENEIAILQGKLQGIREIEALFRGELEKRLATLVELRKENEKKEAASSGKEDGQPIEKQSLSV